MFRSAKVSKQEKLASKNKIRDNEVGGIECVVVGFMTKQGQAIGSYAKDTLILVVVQDPNSVPDSPNLVRTTGGAPRGTTDSMKEVSCYLKWTDDAKLYVENNITDAKLGSYRGSFKKILDYWDTTKNCVAKTAWFPLADQIFSLTVWSNDVPASLCRGSRIVVNGSFQQYIYCPMDKKAAAAGGAGAVQKKDDIANKITVVDPAALIVATGAPAIAAAAATGGIGNSPMAPQDAQQEAQKHSKSLLSPEIRTSMSTNGKLEFSSRNVVQSAFDSFQSVLLMNFKLPEHRGDDYCLILNIRNHQADVKSLADLLPGPETVVVQTPSFDVNDLQKAPPKQDPTKTDAREMCKTVGLKIYKYGVEGFSEEETKPWTVLFSLYQSHALGLGMSWLETWLKFGGLPWEGVAVLQVDADTTLSLATNRPDYLESKGTSGQLNCWVKSVAWDVDGTVRRYGYPVRGTDLFPRLYADIYDDVQSKGQRKVLCDMGTLGARLPQGLHNELHVQGRDSPVINVNEWTSDAGWMCVSDEREFYVLVHLPVPPQLIPRNGENNDDAISDYMDAADRVLRKLSEAELIDVLLGVKTLPNIITYTQEEVDALARIQSDEERAKAYPGRGPSFKRKYVGSAKTPSSMGFDFIVYALQKREKIEIQASRHIGTALGTTPGTTPMGVVPESPRRDTTSSTTNSAGGVAKSSKGKKK